MNVIWMKHAEHGGIAQLPDLPQWRALGWEPTDERPEEPDTLRDPGVEPPTEATEQEPKEALEESGASSLQPEQVAEKPAKKAVTSAADKEQ